MKVIVLDHHICTNKLPNADVIINPNRVECESKQGYLAAVGVSFMLIIALSKKLNISNDKVFSLLDLVALGTVCDAVPLIGLNRVLVKHGLKVIENKLNIGIKALMDVCLNKSEVDVYHLGFILGPRINAGGRVGSNSSLGANLLSIDDYEIAVSIASELDIHNNTRRAIELNVLEEAIEKASLIKDKSPLIYVYSKDWHIGVIGIIAGRLKEKFNKPTVVITIDENGIGKASCRSISGIDMGDAIILAKEKGILVNGGGHAMAAGFTINENMIDELHQYLINLFQTPYDKIMEKNILIILLLKSISIQYQ